VLQQISSGADFTEISQGFLGAECSEVIGIRQTINRLHQESLKISIIDAYTDIQYIEVLVCRAIEVEATAVVFRLFNLHTITSEGRIVTASTKSMLRIKNKC
jgi:hypothetical protein